MKEIARKLGQKAQNRDVARIAASLFWAFD